MFAPVGYSSSATSQKGRDSTKLGSTAEKVAETSGVRQRSGPEAVRETREHGRYQQRRELAGLTQSQTNRTEAT